MAEGRQGTLLRLGKPILAGLALAYLVTAFVDKPAPVHFQPDNPYAAQQSSIVEPETTLVTEKNIMKLGSPLSVMPDRDMPETNPLSALEEAVTPADGNAPPPQAASAAEAESAAQAVQPVPAPSVEPSSQDDTAPAVRGEVDTVTIPAPEAP
jgi:hypothetical protein